VRSAGGTGTEQCPRCEVGFLLITFTSRTSHVILATIGPKQNGQTCVRYSCTVNIFVLCALYCVCAVCLVVLHVCSLWTILNVCSVSYYIFVLSVVRVFITGLCCDRCLCPSPCPCPTTECCQSTWTEGDAPRGQGAVKRENEARQTAPHWTNARWLSCGDCRNVVFTFIVW